MAKWRLAQQKTQEDDKSKAGKAAPKKRERRPGELSRGQKAVIIVFVAIFALSTLAGALASVFQSTQQQSVEYNVDYVDSQYEGLVSDLEETLESNPDDTSALLQVARYCTSWGSTVGALAQTDDERAHGEELLQRAIGYYDRYLELDNTAEASADRALCEYYLGETDTAVTDMETVTQVWPDYAPAWANLGMLYESQDRTDEAIQAYQMAIEKDPDDAQGAKSYAEGRIEDLRPADDGADAATTGDAGADGSATGDTASADGSAATTDDTTTDDSATQ